MRQLRRSALAALVAGCVLSTAGCVDTDQMLFVKDERLTFTAPDDYEKVQVPLTISWTMDDFTVLERATGDEPSDDAGYFAVFVDRSPIKPGKTLRDVGKGDPLCESNPACPDKLYLESKGVYWVRKPSITLELVQPLTSKEKVQLHQVTVVLLDGEGKRIGEHAWYRYFKLENKVLSL